MVKFKPGDVIDDEYDVQAVLAETSTAIVYKAKEKNLGRLVAIKTPKPEFLQIKEFMSRFQREAKLLARLNHNSVVQLLGMSTASDELVYMALEYFEGIELGEYFKSPPPALRVGEALNILARASEALTHCHERGVIHRDARPENILVTPMSRGGHRVKLIDFDLARLDSEKRGGPDETEEITKMNATIGTPSYLSPEQAQGDKVSAQSDIYSLACVYYYCFTKQLVFTGSVFSVISQHVKKEPDSPTLRNPRLPKEFSQIILRGLAKNPSDRWPSAVEMSRAIQTVMRPHAEKPFSELVPPSAEGDAPGTGSPRPAARTSSPRPVPAGGPTPAPAFGRRRSRESASAIAAPKGLGAAAGAQRDPNFISRQQGKASAKGLLSRIANNSLKNIPILAPSFDLPAYIKKACEETGRDVDMSPAEQAWVLGLLADEEVEATVDEVLKSMKATQSMARMSPDDKAEFRRLLMTLPSSPDMLEGAGGRRGR